MLKNVHNLSFSGVLSITLLTFFVAIMVLVPLDSIIAKETSIENPIKSDNLEEILQRVTRVLVGVSIPMFTLMVAIGSYYIITGANNPGNREKARKIFFYSTLGFFIIMLSAGIVALISSIIS
ncbi:MAG: hypothetical protein WDZ40_02680 [Candidatus Spechtbacterales bacterium]